MTREDLEAMEVDELKAYIKENDLDVDLRSGHDKLVDGILAAESGEAPKKPAKKDDEAPKFGSIEVQSSMVIPENIVLKSGVQLKRGQVAQAAQIASGMDVEAWNALEEAERDDLLKHFMNERLETQEKLFPELNPPAVDESLEDKASQLTDAVNKAHPGVTFFTGEDFWQAELGTRKISGNLEMPTQKVLDQIRAHLLG